MSTQLINDERLQSVDKLRAKYNVQGLAFAVVGLPTTASQNAANNADSGLVTQIETFGTRNCNGDKFEKDTIFAIASNSKMFASLSVSLLIARGTKLPNGKPLTWSTKVKDVLGDAWKVPDEWTTTHADLDDLAGMRLGMAQHAFAKMPLYPPLSPLQQLYQLRHLSMAAELRQVFSYDSNCYLALSHIVPTLTGRSYHAFLEEEIFIPLGMNNAFCDSNKVRATGRAVDGFLRRGGSGESASGPLELLGTPVPVGWWTQDDGIWCLPHGGLAMSIEDAAKIIQEFLVPRCLPPKAVSERAESLSPSSPLRTEPPPSPCAYGRGVCITIYRGETIVWHTGNLPGQASLLAHIPAKKIGMFIAINDGSVGAAMVSVVRNCLLDDLLGLEPTEDYEKKYIGAFIGSLMSTPTIPVSISDMHASAKDWSHLDIGTFHNRAYTTMTLTAFGKSTAEESAMIDIARWKGYFHEFDESSLVAKMGTLWLSHLVFRPIQLHQAESTHGSSNRIAEYEWNAFQVYNVVDRTSQPKTDEFVATLRGRGTAFITSKGAAMFGGFSKRIDQNGLPVDPGVRQDPLRIENEAEAWFSRIA